MTDKEKIIEEFKKSIWHKPEETPVPKHIVVVGKYGDGLVINIPRRTFEMQHEILFREYEKCRYSIKCWCYLKDILPKDDKTE